MIGLFILKTPEHQKVLINLFGEIIMLMICGTLIIYFTDRNAIPLNKKEKYTLTKILALLLPIFYKFGPLFSRIVTYFTKMLTELY